MHTASLHDLRMGSNGDVNLALDLRTGMGSKGGIDLVTDGEELDGSVTTSRLLVPVEWPIDLHDLRLGSDGDVNLFEDTECKQPRPSDDGNSGGAMLLAHLDTLASITVGNLVCCYPLQLLATMPLITSLALSALALLVLGTAFVSAPFWINLSL